MKIKLLQHSEEEKYMNVAPIINKEIVKSVELIDIKPLTEKNNIATYSIISQVETQLPISIKIDSLDKQTYDIVENEVEAQYNAISVIEFVVELLIGKDVIESSDVLASNVIEIVDDGITYNDNNLTKFNYENEIENLNIRNILKGDGRHSLLKFKYEIE